MTRLSPSELPPIQMALARTTENSRFMSAVSFVVDGTVLTITFRGTLRSGPASINGVKPYHASPPTTSEPGPGFRPDGCATVIG
jgi:hypothetical protein